MDRVFRAVSLLYDRLLADRLEGASLVYLKAFLWPAFTLAYCLTHVLLGQFRIDHVLFSLLVLALYFVHPKTRIFILLALPVVIKDIVFDFLRYIPFDFILPIHISEPYQIDLSWFGWMHAGKKILLNDFFLAWTHPALDLLCGIIYILHEPIAILLILLIWRLRSPEEAGRYTLAFLLMNFLAFATYFLYPAAPPWYVTHYGFMQPLHPIAGDPGGLIRFDALLGFKLTSGFYGMSPVVFGAIPSMHAGFASLGWLYALQNPGKWKYAQSVYLSLMCFAAVYLQHHYVIDLFLGMFYAALAFFIVEKWRVQKLGKIYPFILRHFTDDVPVILKKRNLEVSKRKQQG